VDSNFWSYLDQESILPYPSRNIQGFKIIAQNVVGGKLLFPPSGFPPELLKTFYEITFLYHEE